MSGRETFGSRFGSLMALLGVAVGLANVWRFPYMAGNHGGAAFVALYVLFGILTLIALGFFVSRGKTLAEINQGSSIRIGQFWIFWIRWVIPAAIVVILVSGWWPQLSQWWT